MAMPEEEAKLPEVTHEFIEEMVGKPVASFEIRAATVPGENYMSVLYCVEVQPKEGPTLYTICKCYPLNPHRQMMLNKTNIFWNEWQVYRQVIPTLQKFATQNGKDVRLPFAPLVNGTAFNFGVGKENDKILAELNGKIFDSFDNYLAMVDMKRTHGFRLGNRFTGLTLEEVQLIMDQHAKLHATAWAYKKSKGLKSLVDEYKFLAMEMREEDKQMWDGMMRTICGNASDILKGLVGEESELYKGTVAFSEKLGTIMEAMLLVNAGGEEKLAGLLRVPQQHGQKEYKPWRTLVHGDCWVNNLLFQYDEGTGKAVEAVLIDLQIMREACPTLDLVYLLFTSTTREFRSAHLDGMLRLFYDRFLHYCALYNVQPYEGFDFEELKRRFHANKLMGYMMTLMVLPIILKDSAEALDMEKLSVKEGADMMEMFEEMMKMGKEGNNSLYHKRLVQVAEEMHRDGVI